MKAVVMESENGRSFVLTEEGLFCEVRGDHKVGSVIDYTGFEERKPVKASSRIGMLRNTAAAACLALVLLAGTVAAIDPGSYATVDLSDEYSVQYLLDKDLKVTEVKATGEDGRELAARLESEGVRGRDINEAISMTEDLTGISYDADGASPEVSCRNGSDARKIKDDISAHHDAAEAASDKDDPAGTKSSGSAGPSVSSPPAREAAPDAADRPGDRQPAGEHSSTGAGQGKGPEKDF